MKLANCPSCNRSAPEDVRCVYRDIRGYGFKSDRIYHVRCSCGVSGPHSTGPDATAGWNALAEQAAKARAWDRLIAHAKSADVWTTAFDFVVCLEEERTRGGLT